MAHGTMQDFSDKLDELMNITTEERKAQRDALYALLDERMILQPGSPRWRAVSNEIARMHGWPENY